MKNEEDETQFETIEVRIIGYKWTCPKCHVLNDESPNEYCETQPVTCRSCGRTFEYSLITI